MTPDNLELRPSTDSTDQKAMWESLAKQDAYLAVYGKPLTPEGFRASGEKVYKRYILDDEIIGREVPDPKQATILDIGCGVGRVTEFMARDFKRAIGTDISGEMIRQARGRLAQCANVELIETDGNTLPLPGNSVDLAYSHLVYPHVMSVRMIKSNFEEVYRVLCPGGLFKASIRSMAPMGGEYWRKGAQFDKESYRSVFEGTGFRLLRGLYSPKIYSFWLWLRAVK